MKPITILMCLLSLGLLSGCQHTGTTHSSEQVNLSIPTLGNPYLLPETEKLVLRVKQQISPNNVIAYSKTPIIIPQSISIIHQPDIIIRTI